MLAKLLPDKKSDKGVLTDKEIRKFFYIIKQKKPRDNPSQVETVMRRQKGLLKGVPNHSYRNIYRFLIENKSKISFTNVGKLLKTGKSNSCIITRVLEHVVLWLNRRPTALYS